MDNPLIIDLRNNRCAVGLLRAGQARWQWISQSMFIHVTPDDQDAREEADLTFFRPRGANDTQWQPIDRTTDLDQYGSQFDRIDGLFDQPADRLQLPFLRATLGKLLKAPLSEHPGSPLLLVIDKIEVRHRLEEFLGSRQEPGEIFVVPETPRNLTGFALIGPTQDTLPVEGESHVGWINQSDGSCKARSFTWSGNDFSIRPSRRSPPADAPRWNSEAEMERVGMTRFASLWQKRLRQALQQQAETLRGEVSRKELLHQHMRQLIQQVREAWRISPPTKQPGDAGEALSRAI